MEIVFNRFKEVFIIVFIFVYFDLVKLVVLEMDVFDFVLGGVMF